MTSNIIIHDIPSHLGYMVLLNNMLYKLMLLYSKNKGANNLQKTSKTVTEHFI